MQELYVSLRTGSGYRQRVSLPSISKLHIKKYVKLLFLVWFSSVMRRLIAKNGFMFRKHPGWVSRLFIAFFYKKMYKKFHTNLKSRLKPILNKIPPGFYNPLRVHSLLYNIRVRLTRLLKGKVRRYKFYGKTSK